MSTTELTTGDLIDPPKALNIVYDDEKHKYTVNGDVFPSVTTILDAVTPKPALTWWGFRVGLAAAVELARDGLLPYGELVGGHDEHQRIVDGDPSDGFSHVMGTGSRAKNKTLIEMLAQQNDLDPNKVKGRAAFRGTGVHEALNVLGLGGTPDIESMPENQRPYALALNRWWLDQADMNVRLMEQAVASLEHTYAGRFDLLYETNAGQLVLADLKTSKEVRPDSNYRQLMAYKLAWEEMGGRKVDRIEIILCKPDGNYAVYDATPKITPEIWQATMTAYKAVQDFKALQRVKK